MDNAVIQSLSLSDSADRAIASLVSARAVGSRVVITMPVASCTGSLVSVSLSERPSGMFLISDDGCAFREVSDNLYSTKSFAAHAKKAATKYGATFDGYSMLFVEVDAARLKISIIAMATLAKEVIDATVAADSTEKADKQRDQMRERIGVAFKGANVIEDVGVSGYSTQEYQFDYLVEDARGRALFQYFNAKGVSINATFAKFSDVHQREDAPLIAGVTADLDAIGKRLILLRSVADSLICASAPLTEYDLLAA